MAHFPAAVLFDRDGTLVFDVPYNTDPARVRPMPGAWHLLDRLRRENVRVGIVSNQSGIGRGLITQGQLDAVTQRLTELLGPFDVLLSCPHLPEDGCECRKPAPGMIHEACRRLGVAPQDVLVVGDIGSDMQAAERAGAQGVLVPTPLTRAEEVDAAPHLADDLSGVEDLLWPRLGAPLAGAGA